MGFGIFWEITNACNLRCRSCLPNSAFARKGELQLSEVITTLDTMSNLGATTVQLSGGEPFQRPDLLEIVEHAVDVGMGTSIITNASLVDPVVAGDLARRDVSVNVSLDGAVAATHDAVRGKGSFEKAITGLQYLVEAGVETTLAYTINQRNFDEIAAVVDLARTIGCLRIFLSEIVKGGRAARHWADLGLTEDQRDNLVSTVDDLARDQFQETMAFDDACWVDGSSIYVNSTGQIYLCSELGQRQASKPYTSVRDYNYPKLVEQALRARFGSKRCCYGVFASPHVTLVANTTNHCALLVN